MRITAEVVQRVDFHIHAVNGCKPTQGAALEVQPSISPAIAHAAIALAVWGDGVALLGYTAHMTRIAIQPTMLRWARERARLDIVALEKRFPKYADWEAGELAPTMKQLESFAKAVYVPEGYLFLPEPPVEEVPIPDFRTMGGRAVARPSPNLLDTIYACQSRQDWYREYAQQVREPPLPFVGSLSLDMSPVAAAKAMADVLEFDLAARRDMRTWEDALRSFISQVDRVGVMVMMSGVVMSNNQRKLDPEEFRGFALSDALAPLVFVNGADTKAAQMFTLAHELAHIGLGQSALTDITVASHSQGQIEQWCNQVAAEMLAPLDAVRTLLHAAESLPDTLQRLARHFKVSTLVVLRRLLDVGVLDQAAFHDAYVAELARVKQLAARSSGGGDFYRTTLSRVSRRFAGALVESTLEGRTLYRDAFHMLGVRKTATFNEIGRQLGMVL